MTTIFMKGASGPAVAELGAKLSDALDGDAAQFPGVATATLIDDDFDAAIRRWQGGVGLIADGVIGPLCQSLLGLIDPQGPKFQQTPLTMAAVSRMFPATKPANLARYLPYVEAALGVTGLTDAPMVLGALGTIRAETEGFVPISEFQSRFNTEPGKPPFSLYDFKKSLGNGAVGDGARYRGRGFVQLTGKANYAQYGAQLKLPLDQQPELANAPEIAAMLLALFLADHAKDFRAAVAAGEFAKARKLVNGGAHGLDRFKAVFDVVAASGGWPTSDSTITVGAGATVPRHKQVPVASKAKKDAVDLRDRQFMPVAISLPDVYPPTDEVEAYLGPYTRTGLVLDQGREGACTGFGLACVINYLRWVKARCPARLDPISPRMLYTLARRYDEYAGENYEGSSCRGAIKGWFHNGVCLEDDWPYSVGAAKPPKYGYAARAAATTLGVYYRVDTRSITDMQAAIHQHRAVFVSAFVHDGWSDIPNRKTAPKDHADLPLIAFDGHPSKTDGHAFALVGYDCRGFIVQNSWGKDWGAGGFAVLSYLDWLANGMDAWVVSLGVPGVVAGRLASGTGGEGAARRAGAADKGQWWDEGLAYRHSVVLGNDGRVSRYLTEDERPRKLQHQAYSLPDLWFREQKPGGKKRVVLYAHGGLNSESDAIARASAMGRYFIGNGCYPLFLVWKTGLWESIGDILADKARREPARAGGILDAITEKTDALLERSVGRQGARPLWSEMKENAQLAYAPRHGGELLLDALCALSDTWKDDFELHLVGHSAGSIALGHFVSALRKRRQEARDGGLAERLASVHLYAPACTVAFANQHYAADAELMKRLHLDLLSDEAELDDNVVFVYRKSLLYLVSNALEADLRTPLLGLDLVGQADYANWDGTSDTGEALAVWREAAAAARLKSRTTLTAGQTVVAHTAAEGKVLKKASHGGFDNDIEVVGRTLGRILGVKPEELPVKVDDLRGY